MEEEEPPDEHAIVTPSDRLDCYPYTFSPLLLLAQESYFDKGHSNYNSVAQFFRSVVQTDMLSNVLYDRKNMLYEELLEHVTSRRMLVTCCIDSHFTAFQILGDHHLIYYDPLKPTLTYVSTAESYRKFVCFLLLKCNYGDNGHLVENKGHYVGPDASATRRVIYKLWRDINKLDLNGLYDVRTKGLSLNLNQHLLVNSAANPRNMSTQPTGNTCYFQTYLFGLLCKVGAPALSRDGSSLELKDANALADASVAICTHLLTFFADDAAGLLRPLTNSNVLLDFHRHLEASYFGIITRYLTSRGVAVPEYENQCAALREYFFSSRTLHTYSRFSLSGTMSSTPNSKSLQLVTDTEDGVHRLCGSNYYKYRAANLMHGFNTGITGKLSRFAELNALRKNQLLAFYGPLQPLIAEERRRGASTKYRDYYFQAQFEIGQRQLVDVHQYTYELDMHAMLGRKATGADASLTPRVHGVNGLLGNHVFFSTNRQDDYDKFMSRAQLEGSRKVHDFFLDAFMSVAFFNSFAGLGLTPLVLAEKEVNSLTRTAFYGCEFIGRQAYRNEYEFEKECINQMARSTLRGHTASFSGAHDAKQTYTIALKIGFGVTYSKYNTLMHFLNVAEAYWHNPDLNAIQVFGKDVRGLLAVACQKIFFEPGHDFYHYGPIELPTSSYSRGADFDLQLAGAGGEASPSVSREKRGGKHTVVVTDRVFEYGYLRAILEGMLTRANGVRIKSDDAVLNLSLLSLLLDFGLYEEHAGLLHLPFLKTLTRNEGTPRHDNKRELQVEISNWIHDFDRRNTVDAVTRLKVEELLFEASYTFMVNRHTNTRSAAIDLIATLNADPVYHQYVLLVKAYVSLCQINQSVEVDYYKVYANSDYRIVIPTNFSKATGDYLEHTTRRYTFSERDGMLSYGELPLFDLRDPQPQIELHKVRLDSGSNVSSMVKYIEVANVFRALTPPSPSPTHPSLSPSPPLEAPPPPLAVDDPMETDEATIGPQPRPPSNALAAVDSQAGSGSQYLIFIADNALLVEVSAGGAVRIRINRISVHVATAFFNEAISFVPCFRYDDSEDVVLFTSRHIHYLVDSAGQFNENYYGMKHELIACITSEQRIVDLNDEHVFKPRRLSEMLADHGYGESKTVLYYPNYTLTVHGVQQLINLLDLAIYLRNVSFFILVLLYLRRASVQLEFIQKEDKVTKISGPWREAILYALNRTPNAHYDAIFERQFVDLNQHEPMPLAPFIDELCQAFTTYQRCVDGACAIVPTEAQRAFLKHIIVNEAPFHFSEVGSGKTKVILPLLCQAFLSNNAETHAHLARGGASKHILVVLVPEHLLADARAQVFRYCLNLNFREEYRIYDDIFALLHDEVQLRSPPPTKRAHSGSMSARGEPMKRIFVTSFNAFKKALTYDAICAKVRPHREHMLLVIDEVDDFLDRDKLVFNICSNKANNFNKTTLDAYHDTSRAVYLGGGLPALDAPNPEYWRQLHLKLVAIHEEIQDKSRSINKSFGIFNEQTLRHSSSNIAQDVEGYKSLIARPYESVNRAMPGSYYSDVERTIYLTYYILREDASKYDELFQHERKFISFEYASEHVRSLEYDELVYGSMSLSELLHKHPETRDGLTRFLYEIILRRMEIRDKSRSVNSIDVVFNFDAIGFTGTPFIDNYPTAAYIRQRRQDAVPDLIDRSFYAYSSEKLAEADFASRLAAFQGKNGRVLVRYVNSDFMQTTEDELAILKRVFVEQGGGAGFNVLVDLCGLVKKASIGDVRDLVLSHFGDRYDYLYHIDQIDGGDRILHLHSDADVPFDEELYNYLCTSHGAELRSRILFFVDNRNVIGKDVPFQLLHMRRFGVPLFRRSLVLAHDVDDFSKIWQAMGRSRTMNETDFVVYSTSTPATPAEGEAAMRPIGELPLTRALYVKNCDLRVAGNLSSIYQTLISLLNLARSSFYHADEIVNVFVEKMEATIGPKVRAHDESVASDVLGSPLTASILRHILHAKLRRSSEPAVASVALDAPATRTLLRHVVEHKFDQRAASGDVYDLLLSYLCGEQSSTMEISYTKQQQKQKAKQRARDQDSDTMQAFDKRHQLLISAETDDYFAYTLNPKADFTKVSLHLPIASPVLKLSYAAEGETRQIRVYPTLQFLYSHHIRPEYITSEVKELLGGQGDASDFCAGFLQATARHKEADRAAPPPAAAASGSPLDIAVEVNLVKQSPQYSMAALSPGVYVVGMKEEFNIYDLPSMPMAQHVAYVADEMGFILYTKEEATAEPRSIDSFGPYGIEQYILMEVLSKHEVAQNVLEYYVKRKEKLERGLSNYSEAQGKGFICWRFIEEARQASSPELAAARRQQ